MMMILNTQLGDEIEVSVHDGFIRIVLDNPCVRITPEEALQVAQALRVYGEVMALGSY